MAKNIKKNANGYNYKYTDLPNLNLWLEQNDMDYYQYVENIDGIDYIVTVPIIDGEEQQPRRGCRVVQAVLSGKSNPAQEQGSAITYARRYSVLMAFGLACSDDDAECMSVYHEEEGKYKKISAKEASQLKGMIEETDSDTKKLLKYVSDKYHREVKSVDELTGEEWRDVTLLLAKKGQK